MTKVNVLKYHLTTWKCTHHRGGFEFKANSPEGSEKLGFALSCPKCGQFGIKMVSREEQISYKMPVYD